MNVLQEVEEFITHFNQLHDEDFAIDSVRVTFSKQHKLEKLKKVGRWHKVQKNSNILAKLKRRLSETEITSAWRLENENIYFYNKSEPPKYRSAELVIFGMKQYHKPPPNQSKVREILAILKDVTNIDLCVDLNHAPNLEALRQRGLHVKQYFHQGTPTDTHYLNSPSIDLVQRICIYNKSQKNALKGNLWRIEATIAIPNVKDLILPLWEFKTYIIDPVRIGA